VSYEATIASFGGDDTTLANLFIISLKNVAANWLSGGYYYRGRFLLLPATN
jgi:hypothetical protein